MQACTGSTCTITCHAEGHGALKVWDWGYYYEYFYKHNVLLIVTMMSSSGIIVFIIVITIMCLF
jgi:hypothetical protein